tara:strand:- start:374 stop:490 length:117 start_codon:yes stop_codon:yes gene_type:complete
MVFIGYMYYVVDRFTRSTPGGRSSGRVSAQTDALRPLA